MQTHNETSDSMFVMDFKYNRNSKLSPTVHENKKMASYSLMMSSFFSIHDSQ